MATLYIVPTPIGNLDDMTFRAVEIMKKVSIIAAEDTRVTRKLLSHFGIETGLVTYHDHSQQKQAQKLLEILETEDVALVSDAGTPGISDPGYDLIRMALSRGVRVEALPGATAFVPALVASGLPTESFLFLGFLPKKEAAKINLLQEVKNLTYTMIFYESPHRVRETILSMSQVLGPRRVCVAREISKKYEEFIRSDLLNLQQELEGKKLLGEVTIVVEGGSKTKRVWSSEEIIEALKRMMADQKPLSLAARVIAQESGWVRSSVYKLGLSIKEHRD